MSVVVSSLAAPRSGFARAVSRRRALSAVVLSTALSLLATGVMLPRVDVEAVAADALRPDMTQHERTQAIETAAKLYRVQRWAAAAGGPLLVAFGVALALWLAFRTAAAPTAFKATFTVAAHALVPQALKELLAVPAALVHAPVAPAALPGLLPSSLAALLPGSWSPPALAAAAALDLFTLWSLGLLVAGMREASGASGRRTAVVLGVLFAAYVALFLFIPAAAQGHGAGGGR